MIEQFIEAKFTTNVATKMSYDNETTFNEGNITNYLSELEEYISNLITIIAYKRGDPHPAISSVPLERLTLKEFVNKDLTIIAPESTDAASKSQNGDDFHQSEDFNFSLANSREQYLIQYKAMHKEEM